MKYRLLFFSLLIVFLSLHACSKEDTQQGSHGQERGEKQVSQKGKIWVEGFRTAKNTMKKDRGGSAGIITNGYLHIFGGIDGKDFLKTSERAKLNPDGSIGEWIPSETLNEARGFFYAVSHNGYVYAIGGANGPNGSNLLNTVERATLNPDGSIGPWVMEEHAMKSVRRCSKAVLIGEYIYAIGGYNGSFIDYAERTKINPDGTLGEWKIEENFTVMGRYIHAVAKIDKTIYVVGGHHESKGSGLDSVEWTTLDNNWHMKEWQEDENDLLIRRYGHNSFSHNNYLYAVGGLISHEYINSVEAAKVESDGKTGKWRFLAPLNNPRESGLSLIHKGNYYIAGGSNLKGFINTVEWASFAEDGSFGYWAEEKEANQLLSSNKAVRYEDRLIMSDFLEYYNEGIRYEQVERTAAAEGSYKKTIAMNKGFMEVYQNLGSLYIRQKQFDEALKVFDDAIAINKNYAASYYNKACVYSLANNADRAIEALNEALSFGFDNMEALEKDKDLESIRNTKGYRDIVLKLSMQ